MMWQLNLRIKDNEVKFRCGGLYNLNSGDRLIKFEIFVIIEQWKY